LWPVRASGLTIAWDGNVAAPGSAARRYETIRVSAQNPFHDRHHTGHHNPIDNILLIG
jgi:hypothetical protein